VNDKGQAISFLREESSDRRHVNVVKNVLDKEDEASRGRQTARHWSTDSAVSSLKNMRKTCSLLAAHESALVLPSHIMHQREGEYTQ